jgi:hypothetical protein
MRYLGTIQWEEVILVWLRSEWDNLPAGVPVNRRLIDSPNLNDPEENSERLTILCLYLGRSVILSLLPPVSTAELVDIEPGDLPSLYVVPSNDWYRDTGGTFLLTNAPANLRPSRRAKIRTLENRLQHYSAATTDETLILIAANRVGPYTIIDGNHRAIALYNIYQQNPNMPWRAILIDDPRISYSLWYKESRLAQLNIAAMSRAASLGLLP